MDNDMFKRINTKYLNENIYQLDELYEKKALTLGEYMTVTLLLKNLSQLEQLSLMFSQEVDLEKKGR